MAIRAQAATFLYTYGSENGGVAAVEIEPDAKSWKRHEALSKESLLADPLKLAVGADGNNLIVLSGTQPQGVILQLKPEFKVVSKLQFADIPKEVRTWDGQALIDAHGGFFYQTDLKTGVILRKWNARTGLTPPGNQGEDICLMPDQNLGLASFQKDGKKGGNFGSRVVILDLKSLTPLRDMQLPRNHPELHIAGNLKEQGPNPEVIFVAPKSDTVAVTLDLYGAVAFASLSSVLAGEWKNLDYVPSSANGSWGTAFPDRGSLFSVNKKDYLLISNASKGGGLALFDVLAHKLLQSFPASAGCENPVFLPGSTKAVTCVSGKIKTRGEEKLEKDYLPEKDLLVFDMAPLAQGKVSALKRIAFDKPVRRVQAVDPETSNLLVLVLGTQDSEIVLYDVAQEKILQREPAKGPVARMAVWSAPKIPPATH